MSAESALVLLGGGQDSATCLAWALDRFLPVLRSPPPGLGRLRRRPLSKIRQAAAAPSLLSSGP